MDIKKTGIWVGGSVGLFVVLLVLIYLLFPYLKPEKVAKVKKKINSTNQPVSEKSNLYNKRSKHNKQRKAQPDVKIDSLNQIVTNQRKEIKSLTEKYKHRKQMIDSLTRALKNKKNALRKMASTQQRHSVSVKKASQSLLNLGQRELAPIVNLLDTDQLMNLYRNASSRQRQKLLRTLKPKKAAVIMKKVMR